MQHTQTRPANRINHIVLDIDETSSMWDHAESVPRVVDALIEDLIASSQRLEQETRITIYLFNSATGTRCLICDMDVLRRPSIKSMFHPAARTPLIDSALQVISEVSEDTSERYGEHSFLVFVITDGIENESAARPHQLASRIAGLPGHWTVAALVPNALGISRAKQAGFPDGNIEKWNTTSSRGFAEMGDRIRTATTDFMEARAATGVRGTRNLFQVAQVTPQAAETALDPLMPGRYDLADVPYDMPVNEFAALVTGRPYRKGSVFYQLTKPVTVQNYKDVMVQVRSTGQVYTGPSARQLLGLPGFEAKIQPAAQPGTRIFIQSTSMNRRMIGGTTALILR